ncbi:MAG: hypothetical protein N2378_05525 [Chloroflexaceae bacterium]|nr:hypothetical protein [Chloroflexaceae bacterium]
MVSPTLAAQPSDPGRQPAPPGGDTARRRYGGRPGGDTWDGPATIRETARRRYVETARRAVSTSPPGTGTRFRAMGMRRVGGRPPTRRRYGPAAIRGTARWRYVGRPGDDT